jgi:hypothetical protein
VEFQLVRDDPRVRWFIGLLICMLVVGSAVDLTLFAAGLVPGDRALIGGLFFVLAPVAAAWNAHCSSGGVAKISPDGLVLRAWASRQSYRWSDIVQVRSTTMGEYGAISRALYRLVGVDQAQPVVELKLKRSLRAGLWGWGNRLGTDIFGVPSLVVKTVHVFATDTDGFVRAAQSFLSEQKV